MPSKKRAPTRAKRGLERLCYLLRFKSTQLSLIPTASQPSSPSWLRPLTSSNAALRSIRSALTTWYSHFCRACAEAEGECRWPIMKAPKNISANKTTLTSGCDVMVSYLPSGLRTLGRRPWVQDFANHAPGRRAACHDSANRNGQSFWPEKPDDEIWPYILANGVGRPIRTNQRRRMITRPLATSRAPHLAGSRRMARPG